MRWGSPGLTPQGFHPSLSSVQCFSDTNQMNTHNLAIVFGPTLFQTDGQDYKAGRVVEDLISHYVMVFSVRPQPVGSGRQNSALGGSDHLSLSLSQVDEEELRKQREEITAIVKMRVAGTASGTQVKGRAWGGGLRPATCTCSPGLQLSPVSPQHAGDFICTVYLEEKKAETEQHVKVRARDLEVKGPGESGWAGCRLR